jgi:GntR family transcriptional regulator, transcriptional repressor for pyruvate dehydrogenase complex
VVLEHLRREAVAGVLKPGDRLPSERELTTKLQVSRGPVREALNSMRVLGLAHSRPGLGTFLGEGHTAHLLTALRWRPMDPWQLFSDLIFTRLQLEVPHAGRAAELATPEQVQAIRAAAEAHASHGAHHHGEGAYRFHKVLTEAADNMVIASFVFAAETLFEQAIADIRQSAPPDLLVEHLNGQANDHLRIAAAVEAHDPPAARAAMESHLTAARDFAESILKPTQA